MRLGFQNDLYIIKGKCDYGCYLGVEEGIQIHS